MDAKMIVGDRVKWEVSLVVSEILGGGRMTGKSVVFRAPWDEFLRERIEAWVERGWVRKDDDGKMWKATVVMEVEVDEDAMGDMEGVFRRADLVVGIWGIRLEWDSRFCAFFGRGT